MLTIKVTGGAQKDKSIIDEHWAYQSINASEPAYERKRRERERKYITCL